MILESFGAKLAEFVTRGRAIRMNWTFDRLRKPGMPERWPLLHVSFGHFWQGTNATKNFWKSNCDDLILREATAS